MSLVQDLNSSLGHVTKTLIPQLETKVLELASSVNAQFTALASPSNLAAAECGPLASDHVDNTDNSVDDADGSHGSAPARTQTQPPPAAPPPVDVLGNDNSNTEPHEHHRNATTAPPDHNGTYTLPTGHFGLGLNGPTMASPAPTHGKDVGQMA